MRVRDGNCFHAAQPAHSFLSFAIQKADAVPEHIPLLTPYQEGALPNRERRLCSDTNQIWLFILECITKTICLHLRQRRPLLAFVSHILTLITANWAFRWRFLALSELSAAGYTYPMFHLKFLSFSTQHSIKQI